MKLKRLSLLLLCVFAFVLSGCAALSKKDKQKTSSATLPAPLEPQAILKFSDVPVPVGFRLLEQNSYAFESAGVRVGVLRYQGKVNNPEQVVTFYKEQMPMYNWNLLNVIEYGERLMNFDRESETCIITLLPKGNTTLVTISLGPKAQTPKKANKPVK